jgi:predicted TIM-barrel fold metal-dependent hydrolase
VRTWIDTHIHASDLDQDGLSRGDLLGGLTDVLGQSGADLKFVLSPDVPLVRAASRDGQNVLRAATYINSLVSRAPGRLFGSCLVTPHFLDASLSAMEMCFEKWGFVLLGEMLQYMMDYRLDTDGVETLVRRAVDYKIPVQIHISTSNSAQGGFSSGMEELEDFLGLVDRVPEADYILAHLVGTDKADPPVVDTYLDAIEKRCGTWPRNFWVEIRDFNSPGVRSALSRIPTGRIIAGTDWTTRVGPPFLPYGMIFGVKDAAENPYPPGVSTMVGFLKEYGATDDGIEAIGSRNAAALLKI